MDGRPASANRRLMAALALGMLLLLAGCSIGYDPGEEPSIPEPVGDAVDGSPDGPPDEPPDDDYLGYYDGYWHNQSLDVDPSDGLTDAEAEAVFSRAMARVQLLRGLAFEDDVDIELITREEFREAYGEDAWPEPERGVRILDNAQHEALFLVGPDEDVVEVRQDNRGDLVLGFYEPGAERIVLVSEQDPATLADEITLAHELLHALQDQHFDLSTVRDDGTLDGVNARQGLVEGDAVLVEREYERNCETGEWECVELEDAPGPPTVGPDFHFGVYYVLFFPYAEGPSFVEHHREAGGWERVDAMYEDVPTAAAEMVHPASYGSDAYGEAVVEDRHGAGWERVRTDDGPDHGVVGQSGLASMFAYTAQARPGEGVIEPGEFENRANGGLDPLRPFTYDVSYADGWYADRLHAYEQDGELAHVLNVTFVDEANAAEFQDGYEEVVAFWDGERVGSQGGGEVWTLEESDDFDGAVWIERDGASVTIVHAPTEDDIGEVYAPAG